MARDQNSKSFGAEENKYTGGRLLVAKKSKELEIETLKAEIDRLKKELKKKKKYGLVWEEKSEDVVDLCKEKLPVVKEVKNKGIITAKKKPVNLLIEGDNYHALSVLNYTHKGKIDVIYIDPPYNTGEKDFIYNDHYVDPLDSYKHSKWLSFMSRRLRLAKNLLSEEGFLAVSIDDNEVAQLKLLLDELFNEKTKVVAIKMSEASGLKMGATKKVGNIPKYKEYIIFAKKSGIKGLRFDSIAKDEWDEEYNTFLENFSRTERDLIDEISQKEVITSEDCEWLDKQVLSKVKRVSVAQKLREEKIEGKQDQLDWKFRNAWRIVRTAASTSVKKLADDKRERINQKFFTVLSKQNNILYIVKGDYSKDSKKPRVQILFADDNLEYHPGDFWSDIKTTGLEAEGGVNFKNGKKPLDLIKRIIFAHRNDNAVVLDFFAGSGTTGEAVLDINREKGGNRTFILCSDNKENDNGLIIDEYCYPRMQNTINGYGNKRGYKANLKYFRTSFVPAEPTDKNKTKLTHQAIEMLCIKEGTFELVLDKKDFKIFKNNNHYTGIIFDQLAIPAFKEAIKNIKGKSSVYVFSLSDETFDEEFADVEPRVKLSPIPEAILRVYRRIFR